MPRDIRNLHSDLEVKFSNLDHEIPQVVKDIFYQQVEFLISHLTNAYTYQLEINDKLAAHAGLHTALLSLRCRYIEHYIRSQNIENLKADLSNVINNALVTATPHLFELQSKLAEFLAINVAGYVGFVLLAVQKEFFDLNKIFKDLKYNILTDFVTSERAIYGYDVFEPFVKELDSAMIFLQDSIDVETDINNIEKCVLLYTPTEYFIVNENYRTSTWQTDPYKFMQHLSHIFMVLAQREYNVQNIAGKAHNLVRLAQIHHAEMQTIQDPNQAIIKHYAALKIKHIRLKIWSLTKAPQIINHALRHRCEWAVEIVRLFKGGSMNQVIANYLYSEAEKCLTEYYTLPARFATSPEVNSSVRSKYLML